MRAIDADALQKEYKQSHNGKRLLLIDVAPTIQPEPHWIPVTEEPKEKKRVTGFVLKMVDNASADGQTIYMVLGLMRGANGDGRKRTCHNLVKLLPICHCPNLTRGVTNDRD